MFESGKLFFLASLFMLNHGDTIGSNQYVPEIPQYAENLVPDAGAPNFPVIRLNLGYVRGQWLTSARGKRFAAYKGIPYAQSPLGNLRFEPPQDKKPWQGIRNAFNHGPQCPQLLYLVNKIVGNEDCLYMNLYVPQANGSREPRSSNDELLPVIFFIHGGAWVIGAGDMDDYLYGPDRIMDEDVIVVTINYRLGALGFLYLQDMIPGNMGMKDQSMALKLIQKNARSFGGDPNRIVIMGESAGGASAEFHTLNPESRKIMFGAIAQSGSALAPWAWTRPDVLNIRTRRLARLLRCPTKGQPGDLLECLKRAHPAEIVRYQIFTDWSILQIPIGISFTPTAEPRETPNKFLDDCPRNLLIRLQDSRPKIPYLTGYNTVEGQFFTKISVGLIDSVLQSTVRRLAGLPKEPTTVAYLKTKPVLKQPTPKIVDSVIGEWQFKTPIIDSARHHYSGGSNVFLYHFSYTGRNNFVRLFWDNSQPPTHMDELTYLFKGRGLFGKLPILENASPEAAVSQRLLRMWTNFAKTGNPTPRNSSGIDIYWPSRPSQLLLIGTELKVRDSPLQTSWSSFIDQQCFL
ncbi:juvenile hormone esterase-like [Neodiprion fabricii]|uniref:juvenile hormone esterase-like n=1 Tax=Neodiprion fabricii TaxID=2872261 RepID=UPI001ED91FA4|nr:juvenile hormone esterase-like [Neodiprion fabricii]